MANISPVTNIAPHRCLCFSNRIWPLPYTNVQMPKSSVDGVSDADIKSEFYKEHIHMEVEVSMKKEQYRYLTDFCHFFLQGSLLQNQPFFFFLHNFSRCFRNSTVILRPRKQLFFLFLFSWRISKDSQLYTLHLLN